MVRLAKIMVLLSIFSTAQADQIQQAETLLETIIERDGGPGVSAAVVIDGSMAWNGAAGYADIEWDIPLTVNTRMRIGSVSKPITAAVLLRLADQDVMSPHARGAHFRHQAIRFLELP